MVFDAFQLADPIRVRVKSVQRRDEFCLGWSKVRTHGKPETRRTARRTLPVGLLQRTGTSAPQISNTKIHTQHFNGQFPDKKPGPLQQFRCNKSATSWQLPHSMFSQNPLHQFPRSKSVDKTPIISLSCSLLNRQNLTDRHWARVN